MENSHLDALQQAIEEYFTSLKVYGFSPESIETLKKTFKSNNITIQDWNQLIDIIESTIDLETVSIKDVLDNIKLCLEDLESDKAETSTVTALTNVVNKKSFKSEVAYKVNNDSSIGNYLNWEAGQVFLIKSSASFNNHTVLAELNSTRTQLDLIFDFNVVKNKIINDIGVEQEITATQITNTIKLLNDLGEEVASFEIELPSATNEKAGLMSASDKTKLSALPTADQIAQQHTNLHNEVVAEKNRAEGAESSLHNEVVAEKNRAMGIEAQKEDKANKKNVISGDSTTDYPSIKAVKDFVNDAINNVSAYYITKNATGDAFDSVAQLTSATTFYSGGQVRVPTRNDYCIVRVDENHANATTRYIYQGSQWEFQYIVNEESLTDAQLQAINSGITEAKVSEYNEHITDEDIHVEKQEKDNWNAHIVNTDKHIQSGERVKWNEVENKQIKNKTFDHIPQANELEEGQVGIIPSIEDLDGETIIGEGLEVITDTQGNKTLQIKTSLIEKIKAKSNAYSFDPEVETTFDIIKEFVKREDSVIKTVRVHGVLIHAWEEQSLPDYKDITQEIKDGLWDNLTSPMTIVNNLLDSENTKITISSQIIGAVAFVKINGYSSGGKQYVYYDLYIVAASLFNVNGTSYTSCLKIGDDVFVENDNIADRWVSSAIGNSTILYKYKQ